MDDNIREQIIKDLLENAEKVRIERAITYENSFLDCYENFGINYILGEIFNCSKRIEILRKSEDWDKLKEVMSDLINWSLLTGVCVKLDEKELTKVNTTNTDTYKKEVSPGQSLKQMKIYNKEYYDYIIQIVTFGRPRSLKKYKEIYQVCNESASGCISLTWPWRAGFPSVIYLHPKKYKLNDKNHIYYLDSEGYIYE